jgi:putative PIN family toxin of toxin-antitoxin system
LIGVVLDVNVLISGLISQSGPPYKILDAWLNQRFTLFVSPQILQEIEHVLIYPRIRARITDAQIIAFVSHLSNKALVTSGELQINVLTNDSSDNKFLACAIEAKAEYLVTGNLVHFAEAGQKYSGIEICSPRKFLEVLDNL